MTSRMFGLRQRVIVAVGIAALAFLATSLVGYWVTRSRFVDHVAHNLTTTAELEASRITSTLDGARLQLLAIAEESRVRSATEAYALGEDPDADAVHDALVQAEVASGDFVGLTVVGPESDIISTAHDGFAFTDHEAFEPGATFGEVAGTDDGVGVLHVRVDIPLSNSAATHQLVGHYSMATIQQLIATNAAGGDTLEAHIARKLPTGDVQFITPLRFMPDAAFSKTVPAEMVQMPIVQVANGTETVLIDVNDYRQTPSILALQPIEATEWGLVVKVDMAEALAPVTGLLHSLLTAIVASLLVSIISVVLLIRPILVRMEAIADGAKAVNEGDYQRRINDPVADELGAVARAFDLAVDTMEHSLDEKSRFVAAVSHELRTPLTAVMGLSSTLASQTHELSYEDITEFSMMIHSSADELATLVSDLLTAARMQAGSLVIEPDNLLINELAAASIEDLPADIASKVALYADEEVIAWADDVRVRQIIRNLLTNAHKYGGEQIQVEACDASGFPCLRVRDNGVGVAPEFATKIFDPYQRAHTAIGTTDSVGLGLNISRELAERMGGELTYVNDDGWTVFELRLPAGVPAEQPIDV